MWCGHVCRIIDICLDVSTNVSVHDWDMHISVFDLMILMIKMTIFH